MKTSLSWTLLLGGLAVVLTGLGHDLQTHTTWSSVVTPETVGELMAKAGGALLAILGGIGVVIPGLTKALIPSSDPAVTASGLGHLDPPPK